MALNREGRLSGKVALVVGAGSSGAGWGNGKATAVLFAREGARVLCLDRSGEAARETADLIASEGGGAWPLIADVTDPESLARAIAEGEALGGPIDVLHYNVGITRLGGATDQSPEDWHAVMNINLNGLFNTVRLVVPGMVDRGRGAVVAVSSITGIRWTGVPYVSYAASKAAVIQFIRHLALEKAATGVRANTILPGLMRTPMVEGQLAAHYGNDVEKMMAARDAACPMGRMGDAWDVAYAALFLVSDEAKYITGTELAVDGGISAGIAGA